MTMDWGTAGSFPARYEEINVTAFFKVFAEHLVEQLSLRPGDRLLDVACGTGIVLRTARARVPDLGRAVGLDLTPSMLAVARERSGDGIEFVEGDAQQLPFGDGEFNVVTCQQGVQFMPDRTAALTEMNRVLSGGGRVAIACWQGLDRQLGAEALIRAGDDIAPQIADVARAPFSLGRDELAGLVEGAGFTGVLAIDVTLDSRYPSAERLVAGFETGSPLAFAIAELDPEIVAHWRDTAVANLREYEGPEGLVLPMTTTLVTATSP
jgi:SAM-dependent methyltransferase